MIYDDDIIKNNDVLKFRKITQYIERGNSKVVCGEVSEEDHIKELAKCIQEVTEEELAVGIAKLINDLQKQLKKCNDTKKILMSKKQPSTVQ